MNNVFCARKGGATIKGRYFPLRASDIMAHELERQAMKMERRAAKRAARKQRWFV